MQRYDILKSEIVTGVTVTNNLDLRGSSRNFSIVLYPAENDCSASFSCNYSPIIGVMMLDFRTTADVV